MNGLRKNILVLALVFSKIYVSVIGLTKTSLSKNLMKNKILSYLFHRLRL